MFLPMSASKGEDAVVSQISHDRWSEILVVDQVEPDLSAGPVGVRNNLHEFEEFIDHRHPPFVFFFMAGFSNCAATCGRKISEWAPHKGIAHAVQCRSKPMIQISQP